MPDGFVLEGEVSVHEEESRRPAVVWEDFASVSTRGTKVYVNGSTVETAYLTGSTTATGTTITLPLVTFPAGSGGLTVVVQSRVTANSQAWASAIVYRVYKAGAAR